METSTAPLDSALTPRIHRFREASSARGAQQPASPYAAHLAEAYARFAALPQTERYARACAEALQRLPVYLFPDEWLTGMVYHLGPSIPAPTVQDWSHDGAQTVRQALPQNAELVTFGTMTDGIIPGHVAWHWDWILARGVNGLLEECRRLLAQAPDETARVFYQGVLVNLEALLDWNARHIVALEQALLSADTEDHARLTALLQVCRRVPAEPATTFYEAVQSFYFQYIAVMRENPSGGNGPGRLDYYLWPYLERDLAAGRCTMAIARELIGELFIRIHERVQDRDGHVETIVVGGCHPDGRSAVNPLSTLMVEVIMALNQTHPSVYLRMPEEAQPEFHDLATRYLLHGKNRAQVLNDGAIIPAMQRNGMPVEDARMYACGGCMELMPHGMNSDLLFAATHNVPKVLELTLTGGECLRTGQRLQAVTLPPLTAYREFDAFYAAFAAELTRECRTIFQRFDIFSEAMSRLRPVYLLSSLVADCLARGRELHDGGARYHDYGATPLGIPNAGDALYAIKCAVFDEQWCSAEELLQALRENFAGHEALRRRLRALPKFGQQHAAADAMTNRVLQTICDIYAAYRNRWLGRVKPIIFTYVWAPEAGAVLGATADGQYAGQPIAQGLTPQSSSMHAGITTAIGSHTALSLEQVAGGASSMWDFDAQWATPDTISALLAGFLALGGQIFQGNTTDVRELLRAREQPERYHDLIVRVGGFSARFTALSPAVQDDIIQRYRHSN